MSTTTPQDPIRTMSADAHHHAHWALLNEMVDLLEQAQDRAESVRDDLDKQWSDDDDLDVYMRHISLTAEALDALGPRAREKDPPASGDNGDVPADQKREEDR